MTPREAIKRIEEFGLHHAIGDLPYSARTVEAFEMAIKALSAQPEIIYCKECKYGEQDEVGRWYCRDFGCQVGNDDGSGFCADAERRADE